MAPNPVGIQHRHGAQVVICPELIVVVAVVISGEGRASVLESCGVPVLVNRVVEFTKVELAVIKVLLRKVLPVVISVMLN